jgi:hypothetical protein
MATLNLLYLTCLDTQEWPRDELYMKVADQAGNRQVWSKGTGIFESGVGVGDTPGIYKSIPINGNSATIRLYEDDTWPNGDEFLGGNTVYASQAGSGLQEAYFTREGANYILSYTVTA